MMCIACSRTVSALISEVAADPGPPGEEGLADEEAADADVEARVVEA